MVKYILSVISICIQFTLNAQTIIYGTISNAPKNAVVMLYLSQDNLEWGNRKIKKVKIDNKGRYSIKIEINKPSIASFYSKNDYTALFLQKNDSLNISFDYLNFDATIKFSGKGASENKLMFEKYIVTNFCYENIFFTQKDAIEYMQFEDSILNIFNQKSEIDANSNYSIDFINHFHQYYVYQMLLHQWWYLKHSNLNNLNIKTLGIYSFLQEYTKLKKLPKRLNKDVLSAFTHQNDKITESQIADSLTDLKFYKLSLVKNISHRKQLLKDSLLESSLEFLLRNNAENIYDDTAFLFGKIIDTKNSFKYIIYKQKLDSLILQIQKLNTAAKAPNFELLDDNGKKVSLSSFNGKIVFIDFWATWCGPCLEQLPFTLKLEKKYNKNDVIFLYVNINDEKEKWLNFLKLKNMKGNHLFATEIESKKIRFDYLIRGIPHYVIIDNNGNLTAPIQFNENKENALLKVLQN